MKKIMKVCLLTGFVGFSMSVIADTNTSWLSHFIANKKIIGNKKIATKEVVVAPFNIVNISGNYDAIIKLGKENKVTITADSNILPELTVSVTRGQLNIGDESNVNLMPTKTPKVIITTKNLQGIALGGKVTLQAGNLKVDTLSLTTSGNSQVNLQGDINTLKLNLMGQTNLAANVKNANEVNLTVGGNGQVTLAGMTKSFYITTAGEAHVNAKGLLANDVSISGAGDSDLILYAIKTLTVMTAGKSSIGYYGNPSVMKTSFGILSMKKLNTP